LNRWAINYSAGPFTLAQIPDDGLPRYLAIREPESRFCSLWRSCQRERYHSDSFVVKYGLEQCNPSVLMDVIERQHNEHWERQASWYGETVTPVPCDQLLGLLGLPERRENQTTGNPPFIPEYRLRQHYNRDFDLWNMALDFSPEDRRHYAVT